MSELDSWFVKYRYNKLAKLRLFCFPYAGGNAAVFSGWDTRFAADIDLFAIQLPGRGLRFSEPAISCLDSIVDTIIKGVAPYLDVPCMFVGHSNGALVAYEVARRLQEMGLRTPEHIVLSARRAPHLPPNTPITHGMTDEEFVEELGRYSYTPSAILNDPEALSVFLPMLRADFALGELYDFQCEPVLRSKASLFLGKKDDDVPKVDVIAWNDLLDRAADVVEFEEGHFFIHDEQSKFISNLRNIVNSVRREIYHRSQIRDDNACAAD